MLPVLASFAAKSARFSGTFVRLRSLIIIIFFSSSLFAISEIGGVISISSIISISSSRCSYASYV